MQIVHNGATLSENCRVRTLLPYVIGLVLRFAQSNHFRIGIRRIFFPSCNLVPAHVKEISVTVASAMCRCIDLY